MKKQLLAAAAVAGLAVVGLAAPAQAAPPPWAEMNQASYWENEITGDCMKLEMADGVQSFTLPAVPGMQYTLLVIKAGAGESASDVISWPQTGTAYMHTSGKDISHVIYCMVERRS